MEKKWIASIVPLNRESVKERPKLTVPQQVAYMRDVKGIEFTIVDEQTAEKFLRESNYYFKIKAFEKNYLNIRAGRNRENIIIWNLHIYRNYLLWTCICEKLFSQ